MSPSLITRRDKHKGFPAVAYPGSCAPHTQLLPLPPCPRNSCDFSTTPFPRVSITTSRKALSHLPPTRALRHTLSVIPCPLCNQTPTHHYKQKLCLSPAHSSPQPLQRPRLQTPNPPSRSPHPITTMAIASWPSQPSAPPPARFSFT